MADEAPHGNHMRFRQPRHIAGEAFDIGRTKPAGRKLVKRAWTGTGGLSQVPSLKATVLEKRHGLVLDRQDLVSDIARQDVAAVGDRLQPLRVSPWSVQAPEIRGEAVAGPAHPHPPGTEIHRERLLQSAGRIAPRTRRVSAGARASGSEWIVEWLGKAP